MAGVLLFNMFLIVLLLWKMLTSSLNLVMFAMVMLFEVWRVIVLVTDMMFLLMCRLDFAWWDNSYVIAYVASLGACNNSIYTNTLYGF
jgi:hypothetical protein